MGSGRTFPTKLLRAAAALAIAIVFASAATADITYDFNYVGRLVLATGKPVAGPVAMQVDFYHEATGGSPVLSVKEGLDAIALQDGIFQLKVTLSGTDYNRVFSDVGQPVFVQITDLTNSHAYDRQQASMTPYAAKVPVDGKSLGYDSDGRLTVLPGAINAGTTPGSLVQLDASGRVPGVDGSQLTNVQAASVGGQPAAAVAAAAVTVGQASATTSSSTLVLRDANGFVAASGLQLSANGHAISLLAPAALPADTSYVFPAAPNNGRFLTTDAAGTLSWGIPTGLPTSQVPAAGVLNLTLGSVPFVPASGGLGEDNANFFWDETNLRLGIGVGTAPGEALDVTGNLRVTGMHTLALQRALPTTVNTEIDLGAFALTQGAGYVTVAVTVNSAGFSTANKYWVPVQANATGGAWQTVLPLTSSGPSAGNDATLDVNVNGNTASFRLRRTAGATAGTADVELVHEGLSSDAFTPSTASAAVAAPAAVYSSSLLTMVGGNVGIGAGAPSSALDVNGALTTRGMAAPAASPAGQGRLYFDATTNHYMLSENGLAYAQLATGGTVTSVTGSGPITVATGTTTPSISLGIVPEANGGFGASVAAQTGIPSFATGTLSWLTAGTSVSNLVQLGAGGKLPAVDGSLLTGVGAVTFSGALAGDVTGTQGATTVATVGGATAAAVAASVATTTAATAAGTGSTLVARDSSGNFAATTVTAALVGNVTGNVSGSAATFTGNLGGDVTGSQGATTVATVGGAAATAVATSAGVTAAATSANTALTLVKRDIGGGFSAGVVTTTGGLILNGNTTNASTLKLADKGAINFLGLKAPDTLAASQTWVLPPTDGTVGQVLKTDGSGTLGWASGLAPTGTASGDLTGNFPAPTIAASAVTSAKIAAGTIVDSNISASAAIAASKIAGLGTAAPLNVGTAATNVVQLGAGGKLPAVDGSALTNVTAPPAIGEAVVSGTAGSVLFVDGGGNLGQNNAGFFWDNTHSRLGLGTTPASQLDVKGAGATSATSSLNVQDSGGLSHLFVRDDGNVGIGTTNPGATLEVDGDNTVGTQLVLKSTQSSNSHPMFAFENNSGANLGLFDSYGRMYLNPGQVTNFDPAHVDASLAVTARTNASVAALLQGASGQSGSLLSIQNASASETANITPNGAAYFLGAVGVGTQPPSLQLEVKGTGGPPATSGTTPNGVARFGNVNTNAALDMGNFNNSPFGSWLQATDKSNLSWNYPLVLEPSGGSVGIGTSAPGSVLEVAGAVATAIANKTAAYTLTLTDSVVTADASGAAFAINLPTATSITGRRYTVKKTDGTSNAVTITPSGVETIDGLGTFVLAKQYEAVSLISNGTNWIVDTTTSRIIGDAISTGTIGGSTVVATTGAISGGAGTFTTLASQGTSGTLASNAAGTALNFGYAGANNIVATNAAGTLAFGANAASAALQIDANNTANVLTIDGNRVGIGETGTPGSSLEVKGAGLTSATSALNIMDSSGTSHLFVRDDGNVGVGTTNPTSPLTVAGNIELTPAGNSITTSASQLVFQQSGDTYGATSLTLRNRGGANGAIFANTSLDLVDFGFQPMTGPQSNLRLEHRPSFLVDNANTTGELQWLDSITGSSTLVLAIGKAATVIAAGSLGVGTAYPNSLLQVAGSISTAVGVKTSAYTMTAADSVIEADATSAAFAVTLPTAGLITGRQYTVKKVDATANAVTVTPNGSETIDGAASFVLAAQYQTVSLVSDGTDWIVNSITNKAIGAAAITSGSVGGTTSISTTGSITGGSLMAQGTSGNVATTAAGTGMNFTYAGANYVTATNAAGTLSLGGVAAPSAIQINANNSANTITVDSNRVGIGETGTPGSKLEVKGVGTTSATSSLNIMDSGSTSHLFVRDDGNVGIGTTAPGEILTINGNTRIGEAPSTLTTLNGSISSSATTITVYSSAGYPQQTGTLLLNSEAITYTGTTSTTFTGCVRGALGTTSASHSNGATVDIYLATMIDTSTTPRFAFSASGIMNMWASNGASSGGITGGIGEIDIGQGYGFSDIRISPNGLLVQGAAISMGGFDGDTSIVRESANTLGLRYYGGTGAQNVMVHSYGAYTSATNFERLDTGYSSANSEYIIQTEAGGGGGTARPLTFGSNGGRNMTIATSGNVGIGTTSPTNTLSINGGITTTATAGSTTGVIVQGTTGVNFGNSGFEVKSSTGNADMEFFSADNLENLGVAGFGFWDQKNSKTPVAIESNSPNNTLYIKNTGNVGIGTTSPAAKLEVTGQIVATLPATLTPTGTTQTVDFSQGNMQVVNVGSASGAVTLTFANAVAGGSYAIKFIQGSPANAVTWPAGVKWPGGTSLALTTTNGAVDLVTLFYDGTTYYAAGGNNYQ